MSKKLYAKHFFDNTAGWNTMANETSMPKNISPDLLDVRLLVAKNSIKIAKRMGDDRLGSQFSGGAKAHRGLFQFRDKDDTLRQLDIINTSIYNLNITSGALTSLSSGLTDDADRLYHFTKFNHEAILCEINEDATRWNGTDTVTTKVQDIDSASQSVLTGTVTFAASTAVTGSGTTFTSEISVGDYISKTGSDGLWHEVAEVTDNTNLVLRLTYTGSAGAGSSGGSNVSGDFGKAKWCIEFENMLFLFDVNRDGTRYRNRMWYSDLNKSYSFPNETGRKFFHIFEGVSKITGVFPLDQYLYVTTDKGFFQVSFTGDSNSPVVVEPVKGTVPVESGYAIQVINSPVLNKDIAVILTKRGLYIFHDNVIEDITRYNIKKEFRSMDQGRFSLVGSMVNTKFSEIWFFLSTDNSNTHDEVWVYNWDLNAIYPFTGDWNCGYEMELADGSIVPITGDYSGYITKQNQGYNYNNGTINAYFVTPWLNMDVREFYKTFRYVETSIKNTGNYALKLEYRSDFGDTFINTGNINIRKTGEDVWGTGVWGVMVWTQSGSYKNRKKSINVGKRKWVQLKFSNNTDTQEIEWGGWSIFYKLLRNNRKALDV